MRDSKRRITRYEAQRRIMRDSVAEEITMYLGLKTIVKDNVIEVDTITGTIKFETGFPTMMENVYRFIYVYGSELTNYGLKNRKLLQEPPKTIGW